MIGGEHKKERFSENITGEQNQPKNRGYLTGTQTKTGGYSSGTLQGNWSEERASAGYYDGKPLVGDAKWSTSYRDMTEKETPLEKLVTPKFDQNTLIDIENRTIQAFPGHQPHLDKEYSANTAQNFSTVYQTTYKPHQSTANTEGGPPRTSCPRRHRGRPRPGCAPPRPCGSECGEPWQVPLSGECHSYSPQDIA
ncbi:calcyphosin [Angomonas deanei]|uniref:Uncharacterized protein n=1 Tax=Angomonas deanei TaxID=59799 RepID=A0A7G2CF40_9TRYP|nr:calcyphosin [Angomonas deanei]CAD2217494.1 hypothetical protein, conserved [Angomonas deanei]|eukprot:EPY43109.1 calcyphosin [Angomonas deanei]